MDPVKTGIHLCIIGQNDLFVVVVVAFVTLLRQVPQPDFQTVKTAQGNCCGMELGTTAYQGGHNPYLLSSAMLQKQV